MDISITVEADVNPSEDVDKVKRAVGNLIQNPQFKLVPRNGGSLLLAKSEGKDGLKGIRNLLVQKRIRDVARKVMNEGIHEGSVVFYVNKQAAYVRHISFCEPFAESPLGPIRIEIMCSNPLNLIDWLAPSTTK